MQAKRKTVLKKDVGKLIGPYFLNLIIDSPSKPESQKPPVFLVGLVENLFRLLVCK